MIPERSSPSGTSLAHQRKTCAGYPFVCQGRIRERDDEQC